MILRIIIFFFIIACVVVVVDATAEIPVDIQHFIMLHWMVICKYNKIDVPLLWLFQDVINTIFDISISFNIFFVFFFSDIVELLLSYEASCNSADDKGSSPLHLAAWAGNKDIVDMLLTKGPSIANVNLTVSLTMHMLLHVPSILFFYRKYTLCFRKN